VPFDLYGICRKYCREAVPRRQAGTAMSVWAANAQTTPSKPLHQSAPNAQTWNACYLSLRPKERVVRRVSLDARAMGLDEPGHYADQPTVLIQRRHLDEKSDALAQGRSTSRRMTTFPASATTLTVLMAACSAGRISEWSVWSACNSLGGLRPHGCRFHWPQSWARTSLTSTSSPPTTGPGFDAVLTTRW
jgi:hypothetical protein